MRKPTKEEKTLRVHLKYLYNWLTTKFSVKDYTGQWCSVPPKETLEFIRGILDGTLWMEDPAMWTDKDVRKPTDTEIELRRALFHLYCEPTEYEDSLGMKRAKKVLEQTDWIPEWTERSADLTERLWKLAEELTDKWNENHNYEIKDTRDLWQVTYEIEQLVVERKRGKDEDAG